MVDNTNIDFYAIDFEIANSNPTSPCSIGIVGFYNNKIVYEKSYLINPEEPFEEFTIKIHHITKDMVKNSPNFKDLWPKISFVFDNTILFAHNAKFDFLVLKKTLQKYSIPLPNIKYGCSLKISRILWPKEVVGNHKLSSIALYLNEELNHHDALSDARVCGKIIVKAMKIYDVCTTMELLKAMNLSFSSYNYISQAKKHPYLNNKKIAMSGKSFKMKRKDIILLLAQYGCFYEKNINSLCDYFVFFPNGKEEKLIIAKEMNKQGHSIQILDENSFWELVGDSRYDE